MPAAWQAWTRLRRLSVAVALWISAILVLSSSAHAQLRITEAGGTAFPQRALIVSGERLPSLSPTHVHIIENGVPVHGITIRSLKQPRHNDLAVVFAIDISPTVAAIERAAAAAKDIARQRPPQQQLGLVEADATPPVALGLTRDPVAIQRALSAPPVINYHGETIYQAALTAVRLLARAKIGAGSVIILSDGADQGTPASLRKLIAAAGSAHVSIYGVGIRSYRFNPHALEQVSALGGGRFYDGESSQLGQIFGTIEGNLESQYLIRYSSVQGPNEHIAASIHIDGVPGTYDISYTAPSFRTELLRSARPHNAFWTSTLAILLVAGACGLLLLIAISTLIVKGDRPTSVRARVSAFLPGEADPRLPTTLVDDESNRRISPLLRWLQRLLEGARWWERFREEVEIAQFDRSPIEIALLAMAGSVVGAVIIYAITGSVIPGILTLLAGPVVVRLFVRYRLRRQQRLFAEQLGEHLQEVAATMRAGRSLTDALVMVTEAASEPTHREFELALADERLGMPLDQALLPIGTRMANKDMAQFALVAALDRRTGASTAEVVDRIADGVRENAELRRELRALTAQVSLSRWILSLLPVGVLLLISITDPSYEAPMYHTAFGVVLLILCGLMVIAGSFVMTRLVKVDF